MEVLLTLFWWGFLIAVAMFVFNIVISIVFGAFGLLIAGVVALYEWIRS